MTLESPPWATQAGSFGAEQTRRAVFSWAQRTAANSPGIISGGVLAAGDLALSAAVSGLVVDIAVGEAIVGGTEGGAQGGYYARASSQSTVTLATANATNPRVDAVVMMVADAAYTIPSGGTSGQVTFVAVTGTPTSGATLSNLAGAPAVPASSLLLGYVLVPANATSLSSADIDNVASAVQVGSQLLNAATLPLVAAAASSTVAVGSTANVTAGGTTQTLPSPSTAGSRCAVRNAQSGTATTVSAGSAKIYGLGCWNVSSIQLGAEGALAVFEADGSNWHLVEGAQDTGWVACTMGTGWTDSTYPLVARLVGDEIHFDGVAVAGSSATTALGTLPAAVRPGSTHEFGPGYTLNSASGVPLVSITSAGAITVSGTGGIGGTSLAIAFSGIRCANF